MSEIRLNLIDAERVLCGTTHGSVADATLAALSAEPETVAELEAALTRFINPWVSGSPFAAFRTQTEIDVNAWDAGVIVIDLASRTIAVESTYSEPAPQGVLNYHDGTQLTEFPVHYRLPDDWVFVGSIDEFIGLSEQRKKERAANPPLDARAVLYGRPLLEWIVETINTSEGAAIWRQLARQRARHDSFASSVGVPAEAIDCGLEQDGNPISEMHAHWLMTPREDLRGQSPREVLFAKRDFVDFDLNSREMQWSFCDEGPPCLSVDSYAYRFAGFGTHEWVIYYDLVRHLIWSALLCQRPGSRDIEKLKQHEGADVISSQDPSARVENASCNGNPNRVDSSFDFDIAIAELEEIKTAWLERPQHQYDSRTPAILISNERKRLPIALQPRDMIVDENCPTCQMFADETALGLGVGFWHLDGSHMDDDFAFSYQRTREEWEAERREWAEFSRKFNREWEEKQERIGRGESVESIKGLVGGEPF